jgi:hypothetical protein
MLRFQSLWWNLTHDALFQGLPQVRTVPSMASTPRILPATSRSILVSLFPLKLSYHNLQDADFVVSRGGEYFFAPSLSAIANTLSL